MKVAIFTDAGKGLAFERMRRCSAIKQACEELGLVTELFVRGASAVPMGIPGARCTVTDWWKFSTDEFSASGNVAVIDSHHAGDKTYERAASAMRHCFYMDDGGRKEYPPGVVIDYRASSSAADRSADPDTVFMLGPDYAPLMKEFRIRIGREIHKKIEKVLIVPGNESSPATNSALLRFLSENYPAIERTVLLTDKFSSRSVMGGGAYQRTRFLPTDNPARVRDAMMDCDVAFAYGGMTLYELAATGTPTVILCAAGGQRKDAEAVCQAGAAIGLRDFPGPRGFSLLRKTIETMSSCKNRKLMSSAGRELVDGHGAMRVAKYARTLMLEQEIVIRRAGPEDVLPVFKLSSEPVVRGSSIHSGKITFARHKRWFQAKLSDTETLFLVAEFGGEFAGQVRFLVEGGVATVSISVISRRRGSGAGRVILRKAMEFLEARYPDVRRVKAYIKPSNTASQLLFGTSGFVRIGAPKVNGERLYLYKYVCGGI